MTAASPCKDLSPDKWRDKTLELIDAHPLGVDELVEGTLSCWNDIFGSKIGQFAIGKNILPKPQIMGFLLHELIPLRFEAAYPKVWRRELTADEKDMVHLPDQFFSTEIKTSSSKNKLYGNRSYAQPGESSKKEKSGYYLGVNFGKFKGDVRPEVHLIRFGWLDHADWLGQQAQTGQQAHLSAAAEQSKLVVLYKLE